MLTLALTALVAANPIAPSGVYALDQPAFFTTAKQDLAQLRRFVGGMKAVSDRLAQNRALFASKRDSVYTPEEKRTLLSTWGALFAYFSATEGLRQKYWDFVRLPPTDARHAWGFVLTHTALTALLAYGMGFADVTIGNKQLETIFDEPSDEFGVPRGSFARFKEKAIHVATTTQLVTGDTWAPTVLPALKSSKAVDEPDVKWAWQEMRAFSKRAKAVLVKHGPKLFLTNAVDIAKDTSAHAVFPVQKDFAEWMGDTRVARQGKPLVTRAQVDALVLPRLEPGDVIVTRQNWFLSNIGLPGFWPHAELYVGTAKDLAAYFDADPGVQAWATQQPEKAHGLSQLLEKRFPAKWKAYATGTDFQGHGPIRVIESISEGVSFTAVEHAFGVDYLGAMRPRLSKLEKARAVERAFAYQGRPYDFDFDFFSDSTLVCTELVFKSYQPSKEMKGLSMDLVDVAGRRTLPANELVRRFDTDAASTPQLDFVLFLDAKEKTDTVYEADAAIFRSSWKRLKWDVAQQ